MKVSLIITIIFFTLFNEIIAQSIHSNYKFSILNFQQLKNGDEKFELKLNYGGDIQIDFKRFFSSDIIPNSDLSIRRARIRFEGIYRNFFSFRVMPNFAGSKIDFQDAYVNFLIDKQFQIRVGKYKSPIGLERLQNPTNNTFIELGFPTMLVPNRDLGLMVHGKLVEQIEYQLGLFNGVTDGGNTDKEEDNSKDFVIRIFASPFKSLSIPFINNLCVGTAASFENKYASISNPRLPKFSTSGNQTFIKYKSDGTAAGTAFASGKHIRFVPQVYLYEGRFGFMFEYAAVKENISLVNTNYEIQNKSFQTFVSFMITDDKASYGKVKPKNEIDLTNGMLGAIEAAIRYMKLDADDIAVNYLFDKKYKTKSAKAITFGLNWYLNEYYRISFNYEKTDFDTVGTTTSLKSENVLLIRTQVTF